MNNRQFFWRLATLQIAEVDYFPKAHGSLRGSCPRAQSAWVGPEKDALRPAPA